MESKLDFALALLRHLFPINCPNCEHDLEAWYEEADVKDWIEMYEEELNKKGLERAKEAVFADIKANQNICGCDLGYPGCDCASKVI